MSGQERTVDVRVVGASPGDLGWQLGTVLRSYQELIEEAVDGMSEGVRGFQVLSTVVHRDPPNQVALGAHLGIDRTVLTYLLDSLVEAGLVARVPSPVDRRARKIVATATGRESLAHYEERVAAFEGELLSGLEAGESRTLMAIMGKLATDVRRAKPGTDPCEAVKNLP